MDKKGKIKTIYDAFTTELPVEQSWYKERLEKCKTCDYNSSNVEKSQTIKDKVQHSAMDKVCGGKPFCTACSCCIERKAGQQTEDCGLVTIGIEPKWRALKIESKKRTDLNIQNLTPNEGYLELSIEQSFFIYNLGDVEKDVNTIELQLERVGGLDLVGVSTSCGCTTSDVTKIDSNITTVKIKLTTKGFHKDRRFEKTATVKYRVSNKILTTPVKIVGIKK